MQYWWLYALAVVLGVLWWMRRGANRKKTR
jgi:hypothetical protein